MKNKKFGVLITIVLVLCMAVTYIVYAQAGSEDDPVITLSYIKSVFKPEIKSETTFKIVELKSGQFIYGEEGTEMILRSGSAYAVSTATGGLANVTAGYDATNDTPVAKNNLYIVPRNDGRGFWASTDCVIMIKGGYYTK